MRDAVNKFVRVSILTLAVVCSVACVPTYSLVKSGDVPVAGKAFEVQPAAAWNRQPAGAAVRHEEVWTRNGPSLDRLSFIGGLPHGKALVPQGRKDAQQVVPFRSDMSPIDLTSMLESLYRVRGSVTVFELGEIQPVKFLNATAMRVDFRYVAGDHLPRKGRAIMAVIDGKLYSMQLDGAELHYFDELASEFDLMAETAALRR